MMQTFNIIGKNYDTTLKYINDASKSEWYVPPADRSMTYQTLKQYYQKLLDQVTYWLDKMNGANKKEIQNLSKILDNQNAKLAEYEKLILAIEKNNTGGTGGGSGETESGGGGDITPPIKLPPEELPPALKSNKNLLMYAALAAVALLIIKK